MAHKPSLVSALGHAGREVGLHMRRLLLPKLPRTVLLFPSESGLGSASDLRAIAVASELSAHGWRALCVPPQLSLAQRRRLVALEKPDVLFFQQTRHALNDPRIFPGYCSIIDIDDADVLDDRYKQEIIARAGAASAVVAGSRFLAQMYRQYNPNVHTIWTGTYLPPRLQADLLARSPSIVWAPSGAFGYPQEFDFVIEVITRLAARRQDFDLHIYGIPKARLPEFDARVAALRSRISVTPHHPMPYAEFVSSLEAHAIGLQPISMANPFSRGKSFGKVLGYLVAGVTVIATDELDHGAFFSDGIDGLLLPHDVSPWVDTCSSLLDDPQRRAQIGRQGQLSLDRQLTHRVFAGALAEVLLSVCAPRSERES